MSNKLKQIAAILANDDVRDPQATIAAIEKVLSAADTPVATIKVFDNPDSKGPLKATVAIDYCEGRIEPRHIAAVSLAIGDFADQRAAEEECECDPLAELLSRIGGVK